MSVTITLTPYSLLSSVILLPFYVGKDIADGIKDNNIGTKKLIHIDEQELSGKEFETNLVDRDTLVKTLLEHGCIIEKEVGNSVKCSLENIQLEFYKKNNDAKTPYSVKIEINNELTVIDTDNKASELLNDIHNEYSINTQEASYNKIKERLEEKNMQIESEEVFDDDTIVITVNLD